MNLLESKRETKDRSGHKSRKLNKEINKKCRLLKTAWYEGQYQTIVHLYEKNKTREMYQEIST